MITRIRNRLFPPPPAPPGPPPTPEFLQARARSHVWDAIRDWSEEERLSLAREIMSAALPEDERLLVPSLEKRDGPPLNTWRMQNERMDFGIPEGARVLDVGSGGWPFARATHLADMFPDETTHRMEALKRDERPFDIVDIHALPYGDHAFDFVFCSHVLEHLDDPGRAIRELCRIAPRGYVEVPTRLSDVMFNFTGMADHHRWHGLDQSGTLMLTEWTDSERRDLGDNHFWRLAQSAYRNPFQEHLEKAWNYFFIGIRWEGKLPFVVISKTGEVLDRG